MRSLRLFIVVASALIASSCTYDPSFDVTCDEGETAPDKQCVNGVWVAGPGDLDAGGDTGGDDVDGGVDMRTDMACVPQTDQELCASEGKDCGTITATDNCGTERQPDCGTCDDPEVCGEDNVCSCTPQTATEFCEAAGKDCGDYTGTDNCGETRTENCGTCDTGIQCGEGTPNVCGCPCFIDGECKPEGARNPANQCETCQPDQDDEGWTVAAGLDCNDGDFCTVSDTCNAQGTCESTPKDCSCAGPNLDCSAFDTDCYGGMCDTTNGNCVAVAETDGTPCPDDGVACTTDTCQAGQCSHEIESDKCLINGTCRNSGTMSGPCRECDPQENQRSWTITVGAACDQDSLNCTSETCDATGGCVADINQGTCVVNSACYGDGDPSPSNDCQTCQPSTSQTGFTPADSGSCDDGRACTQGDTCSSGQCQPGSTIAANTCFVNDNCYSDTDLGPDFCLVCDASESQTSFSLVADTCFIDGDCYAANAENPVNDCEFCDPTSDTSAWTARSDGTSCDLGTTEPNCSCQSGLCEKPNTNLCDQ